jgi:predicted patatin/cPLA2 family phospholipase
VKRKATAKTKRSLVLGGGGAKIGWASGVLEVLLEEAKIPFDHIDATSGSVFNLAMLLSGRSASYIANEAWGNLNPREFLSFHSFWSYLTFWRLPSMLTQEAARTHIIPKWGIDLEKIRTCTQLNGHPVKATFNTCDFNAKRIVTFKSTEMNLDRLLAIDAVPGVVPPVAADGTLYVDAMLLKDANLSEAVKQGADEIWIIWTVEERSEWRGGFWHHFGHVFEICAVGNLKRELDAIEKVNGQVKAGTAAPGQRHITVHLIKPAQRLPVDYLFFRTRQQMLPVIESGRVAARTYLADNGLLQAKAGVGAAS